MEKDLKTCILPECTTVFEVTTKNPNKVYCSRSCATVNSNRATQKRRKTKVCASEHCTNLILAARTYCSIECQRAKHGVATWTIQEVQESAQYQTSARLREEARNAYYREGGEYKCFECGYDLHINVCHIVDLHQFPSDTLVRDTCKMDNLVALCKNHHWEFDHGFLEVKGVLKDLRPSKWHRTVERDKV